MVSTALRQLETEAPPSVTWWDVRAHLRAEWDRGQHVAVMAPTGTGKSYLVSRGLLPLWDHALIIDPKPADPDNLKHARWMGAKLTDRYPQPDVARFWGKDPYPDRFYWVQPGHNDLQARLEEALDNVWRSATNGEGWVCYVDEVKLICARQPDGHNLADRVIKMLRYGRARGITFIGGTQSPRYNGPGMSDFLDQPRWLFMGKTKDAGTVERYAELSGYGRKLGMTIVPRLGPHEWWLVGPNDYSVRFSMPGPRALRPPARQTR